MTDLFGTAALRRAVLDAWIAAPARFREDANTEEDHARGYYRDRVIVELAQNAADAAAAAGEPGHLSFTLRPDVGDGYLLTARNTGAPLTASGVQALATMRASAKPQGRTQGPAQGTAPVGRFGVGFAAVRAVSDSITITSRLAHSEMTGASAQTPEAAQSHVGYGVRFDLGETRRVLTQLDQPGLAQAVAQRGADLPILRLPFPAAVGLGGQDAGFTTTISLRLRDSRAVEAVRAQLDALDELLLLALPSLERVSIVVEQGVEHGVEPSVVERSERTLVLDPGEWASVHASGELAAELLADRPVEERVRTGWSVTWALRTSRSSDATSSDATAPAFGSTDAPSGGSTAAKVIHAPTATDEPSTLAATLIATFPLDPSRRHVAPGRVTDEILAHAAAAYVELVERIARDGGCALDLVPAGLPAGALDAALHEAVRAVLPDVPLIPALTQSDADPILLRGRDAHVLQGPLAAERDVARAFAQIMTDLTWLPAQKAAAARVLGVGTRTLADIVEVLPSATPDLLDVLAQHIDSPGAREALADLPIQLVDGRVVHGARGVVVPADLGSASELEPFGRWGLRVADPEQSHPVWLRLGAIEPSPTALLGLDPVRQAITHLAGLVETTTFREELESDDAEALDAILALVRRAVEDVGDLPDELRQALAGIPLVSADGELEAARDLTLPGSLGDELFDGLLPVSDHVGLSPAVLEALGVRAGITVLRFDDVVADADFAEPDDADPDRWSDYLAFLAEHLGDGAYVGEVRAIADLDAVGDEKWAQFLELVTADASARAALVEPVRGQISYAAWWLREHFDAPFRCPGTAAPFLVEPPQELAHLDVRDDEMWTAVGAVGSLAQLNASDWDLIFEQMPDVGSRADMDTALDLWAALARVAGQRPEQLPAAPDRMLGWRAGEVVVCAARYVVVTDEPMWTQPGVADLLDSDGGIVPAADPITAGLVAEFLDADVLSERTTVVGSGRKEAVPAAVVTFVERLRAARSGPELEPVRTETWTRHRTPFVIETEVGAQGAATWWVQPNGTLHAVGLRDLASALAQAHGIWRDRYQVAALLLNPDDGDGIRAETAWN